LFSEHIKVIALDAVPIDRNASHGRTTNTPTSSTAQKYSKIIDRIVP
jgi:hypothetical protein